MKITPTGVTFSDNSTQTTAGGTGHTLDAADGSPVDAVYVDSSGNVGIGTTLPVTTLDVNGIYWAETADGITNCGWVASLAHTCENKALFVLRAYKQTSLERVDQCSILIIFSARLTSLVTLY